jgi:hypothetical protein
MNFDGETIDNDLDGDRLKGQLARVKKFTLKERRGAFVTLAEIAEACQCSESSAGARLRDLRKPRFGNYRVERRRIPGANGLHEYAVRFPNVPQQLSIGFSTLGRRERINYG